MADSEIRPGYAALLAGRWSTSGAEYFLTGCLERPLVGLTLGTLPSEVCARLRELEEEGFWKLRTFVIMPDHFHLLVTLGTKASLADTVRHFKGPLTPALRRDRIRWQGGYYEHRIRAGEEVQPTFLYIFLNPYRANLISADEKWPWYYCSPEDWAWFGGLTSETLPFPEWLQ